MSTTNRPVFDQYPERADIQAEAHARPPLAIASETSEVWNWVLYDLPEDQADWQAPYDPLCRHKVLELAGGQLRIERHTEFVSVTWLGDEPPDAESLRIIALCPGRQLAGARVLIRPAGWSGMADVFGPGRIFGGAARFAGVEVATDFQVGADQMVVYTLSGAFEDAFARGRLVKRLVDLETYRMASLLGLPVVRQATPALQSLEARTGLAMRALSASEGEKLGDTIREISGLLAEVGALRDDLRYRMAASKAYYDIVSDRLASLAETPIGQRQTLKGFVDHRLAPQSRPFLPLTGGLQTYQSPCRKPWPWRGRGWSRLPRNTIRPCWSRWKSVHASRCISVRLSKGFLSRRFPTMSSA
jgi:uncharacterized membrane-anchored protein